MAGFAAGFGEAFTQSYNRAKDRRHDKEQDQLRMQFQEAMAQKQALRDKEKEDRDALREVEKYARTKKDQEERDARLQQYGQQDLRLSNELASERDTASWERTVQKNDEEYKRNRADSKEDKKSDFEVDVKKLQIGSDLRKEEKENDLTIQEKLKDKEAQEAASGLSDLYGLDRDEFTEVYKAVKRLGPSAVSDLLKNGARPPKAEANKPANPAQEQTNKLLNPTPMSTQTEPPMAPPATSETLQINPGWTGMSADKEGEKISDWSDPARLEAIQVLAEDSGDTRRAQLAKDAQARIKTVQQAKIQAEAMARAQAEGKRFVPTNGVVNGEYVNIIESPEEPGVYLDANTGQPIKLDRTVGIQELKDRGEVAERMNDKMTDYEEKVSLYQRRRSNYEKLGETLKNYPGALGAGGSLAGIISQFSRDAQGVLSLLEAGDVESIISQGFENNLEAANAEIGKFVSQGIRDEATANAIANATILQIAFDKAKLLHGSKMSNQDFENTLKTLTGNSSDPGLIMKLGNDELEMDKRSLDSQFNRLSNDTIVSNFKLTYNGANPIESLKPVGGPSEQPNQIKPDTSGLTPVGKTKDGRIVYRDKDGNTGTLD